MAKSKDAVEGKVRALARGGDGVVDTEGGVVFVPGVFVGEQVRLMPTETRAGANWGRLIEILQPSPSRRASPCEHAAMCGGCPWITLEESAQREAKLGFLVNALGHGAPTPAWITGESLGYRRRARMSWQGNSPTPSKAIRRRQSKKRSKGRTRLTELRVGYRGRRSRSVVHVDQCVVLQPVLQHALGRFHKDLLPHLLGWGELRLTRQMDGVVLNIVTDVAQDPAVYTKAAALVSGSIRGVLLKIEGVLARFGDVREIVNGSDGETLIGPEDGFSQAHELNGELVRHVVDAAQGFSNVLELYAGHGNFSVGLGATVESLVTVELDINAVECARENFKRRGEQVRAVHTDAAAYPEGRYDCVILDPPRTGAKDVFARLMKSSIRPSRIIYVSCDTATLARDLNMLSKGGYRVSAATAFDMFPQTAHLESLVILDHGVLA